MIYYEMTSRLELDERSPQRPRRQLDRRLDVDAWRVPGGTYRDRVAVPNAPSWWRGDEDASQTFLHAMGVVSLR